MVDCSKYVRRKQEINVSPMPIIGVYVAIASLLCALAMTLNSLYKLFSLRRYITDFNLSNKFFALNATSLTLLAVATKLTGDLTTLMWSPADNLTKIAGTVFLTIAMGNFFITLGSMNDRDILTNVTALSILVITVLVDICIQLITGALDYSLFPEIIFAVVLLFCMFITFVCSALAVPAIKKQAESKYQTLHKLASDEQMEGQRQTIKELRLSIRKHWVMAASGNPPFMMTRLVTFVFASNVCLLSALISLLAPLRTSIGEWNDHCHQRSDYKSSVYLIISFQIAATIMISGVDIIISLNIMYSMYKGNVIKIITQEFTLESFWTEKLVEWRQCPIPMRIKIRMVRKLVHDIKVVILTFCIGVQTVVVMCCKFSCVVSFYIMLPLVCLFGRDDDIMLPRTDLNCYVILLEGEIQLPKRFLRRIIKVVDAHIEKGRRQLPRYLFNLLNGRLSFSGVIEFDSNQVPSLLSDEPLNCWTLPVVTLTSIAIALPNIASQDVDCLVSTVDEGIRYACLIDVLDEKHGMKSIRNAANFVWEGLELHKKWMDIDLERKTREINSAKEIIQYLADAAERIVREFRSAENGLQGENPLCLPINVLAANSMYRISRTILLYYENGECRVEELFRKLSYMIADVLTACLTNLPHLIATKCRCNAIKEREKSVSDAAILLGETEDILKHFERQLSSNGPSRPLCINEWRRWMETQDPTDSVSATSNGEPSTAESNEIVVVEMQA